MPYPSVCFTVSKKTWPRKGLKEIKGDSFGKKIGKLYFFSLQKMTLFKNLSKLSLGKKKATEGEEWGDSRVPGTIPHRLPHPKSSRSQLQTGTPIEPTVDVSTTSLRLLTTRADVIQSSSPLADYFNSLPVLYFLSAWYKPVHIWEERTPTEVPPSDWPVCNPVGRSLD